MSELESAVERWRGSANRWSRYASLANGDLDAGVCMRNADAFTLADAYIVQLDQQSAESSELESTRTEIEKCRKQMEDYLSGAVTLENIAIENGAITLEAGTELARVMAMQFREVVKDAENYVELMFQDGEGKQMLVTVQKCEGRTPHQLRQDAEAKLTAIANRQAAETREHELPVDAEWLESIGFVSVPSKRGPEYADHLELGRLNIWELSGEWLMTEADRFGFRVRGQILDLLSALKIPTKGQS